ncbi:hypothetical protein RHMOL_Rhmol11G0042400 [Rhododendron molle]|uniref:Uncharacterized protein n=1 Tax=Rhododendron molle TaxID=49168 RepID=A0ACC0LNW8_RHOML|nr:hypothetical protein RHMOL_Rhmol11G0042400 [Rhododendron molle]
MADHGGNEGEAEVVDQPGDRGETMAVETAEEQEAEAVVNRSAETPRGGDGIQDGKQEAAGGEESCARAVDSAKGKGDVIEEEHVEEVRIEEVQTTEATPVEIREEDIAFRPLAGTATSSRHVPITYADITKHAPDKILARVLENHPEIREYVLKAKEDRARAIEEAEATARAEREAGRERARPEGLAADMEAEERDAEEARGPRVPAEWVNEAVWRMLLWRMWHRDERLLRRERDLCHEHRPPHLQPLLRHTKSSQPAVVSKETTKKAAARAGEKYRIERRDRSGQGEPARKKQLVVVQPPEEGKEDEEARSDSDDTVDDPRDVQDLRELAAADEDDDGDDDDGGDADGGDAEEDLRDTNWLGGDEDY